MGSDCNQMLKALRPYKLFPFLPFSLHCFDSPVHLDDAFCVTAD